MKLSENLHFFPWSNPSANNCNTYFINGEKKILVDPGHYHLFGHVRDHLAQLSFTPDDVDMVLITHGHPDHMEGIRAFENTDAFIAIHGTEMTFIESVAPHYGEALGIKDFQPDILLKEGVLEIGDTSFQVIHTPGHSPGSVCLYEPDQQILFTGDVVFNQGIGRTDLPGGNGRELKESIKRISRLDISLLLTGHGNVVSGRDAVAENFKMIEDYWFAYL